MKGPGMDNSQLLQAIREHLDEKIELIRQDLKEVSAKQVTHELRIDRLEGMAGYVKVAVLTAVSALGSLFAYISYKLVDFFVHKS